MGHSGLPDDWNTLGVQYRTLGMKGALLMANGSWQLRDALGSNGTSHVLGHGHHSWSNRFLSNHIVSSSSLKPKAPFQGLVAPKPLAVVWHPSYPSLLLSSAVGKDTRVPLISNLLSTLRVEDLGLVDLGVARHGRTGPREIGTWIVCVLKV
jgi:hypothetical protein